MVLLCFAGTVPKGLAQPSEELPPLPGPSLDIPVEVDGDGKASWGDLYAFNFWLERGGDLQKALESAEVGEGFLDLSAFFLSGDAALSSEAPSMTPGEVTLDQVHDGHIDFTRRIPQSPEPDDVSQHPRVTPNGQFIALSSRADLDGSGWNGSSRGLLPQIASTVPT